MTKSTSSLDSIVADAIDLANDAERAAFLTGQCGDDADLRSRAEALIAAHFRAGQFLESPAVAAATGALLDEIGTSIGSYRLLEKLGEGGMGIVYVAEQNEPVRRRVALKIIKPGMDTREVIARFETERQALALMDHPNIARVFDGGTTVAGRPYFVMELVRGLSITDYCDQAQLSPERRLKLFVQVCRAVQHAHQKGVIHRDLKPSNVLITLRDGEPAPQVIDFGVAKAIGQRLSEHSAYTRFTQMIGTPLYMSPEQAELSAFDVDTRSDVYSLGVLLYELLTGTTPFDPHVLRAADFDEMRRMIREIDPPRPSQRLSTLNAQARSTVSACRSLDERQLNRQLRGDLDWIAMKALEKDRNRRYESAGALAVDVERFLANEPVEARPPSAIYRLRKFVKRNRASLAAATVIAVALLSVAGTLGWQMRDAALRRISAERVASAAGNEADDFERQRRWSEAAAAADRAVAVLESNGVTGDEMAAARKRRADLAMVRRLENVRLETATVKNGVFDFALGDRLYAQAFAEFGIDPEVLDPEEVARRLPMGAIRAEFVGALEDWARVRRGHGSPDNGARLVAAADATDPDPWRKQIRRAWATADRASLRDLAGSAPLERLHPCAILLLQQQMYDVDALSLLHKVHKLWPAEFWITQNLADRLRTAKPPRLAEAIEYFRAAVALKPTSAGAWLNLGWTLTQLRRYDEAIDACERAIQIQPDYTSAHVNLGVVLYHMENFDRAEGVLRHAIALDPGEANAHHNLGLVHFKRRQFAAAASEYAEAARLNPSSDSSRLYHGIALSKLGRQADAFVAYREALSLGPFNPEVHNALGGYYCDHERDYDKAIAACRRAIELRPNYALAHANLGNAFGGKSAFDDAIKAYGDAIRLQPEYAPAHAGLGSALMAKGQVQAAMASFGQAAKLDPTDAETPFKLGHALRLRGQIEEAMTAFRQAIRLDPNHAEAHQALGDALEKSGRHPEAHGVKRIEPAAKDRSTGQRGSSESPRAQADAEARTKKLPAKSQIAPAFAIVSALGFGHGAGPCMANDVATDAVGNSYLTGHFFGTVDLDPGREYPGDIDILTSVGGIDIFVAKYAPDGSLIWAARMGGTAEKPGADEGRSITVDASGHVYVCGQFRATAQFGKVTLTATGNGKNGFVMKMTPDGSVLWVNRWGQSSSAAHSGEIGQGVDTDAAGNVYVIGSRFNTTQGHDVLKYDADGALQWAKVIPARSIGCDLVTDSLGNVFVSGSFEGTVDFDPNEGTKSVYAGPGGSGFVLKLTSAGEFVWVSPFVSQSHTSSSSRTNGNSSIQRLALDSRGNIFVGGYYSNKVDFDPGSETVNLPLSGGAFIAKLNADGGLMWVKAIECHRTVMMLDLCTDATGNIYASGSFSATADFDPGPEVVTRTSSGPSDAYVVKLTSTGIFSWVETFGGAGSESGFGLAVDPKGTVHWAGYFNETVEFNPTPLGVSKLTSPGKHPSCFLLRFRPR